LKNLKTYVLLHGLMLLFSFSPICSKLAGQQPLFSFRFFFFYGLVILILGIYAILWQQVIKRLPLTTAYANKAVTVVWGMLWGMVIFGEVITTQKVLGAAIIVGGILLYATADKEAAHE
jgi:drug/metabolite transporter (DMT)-like permease